MRFILVTLLAVLALALPLSASAESAPEMVVERIPYAVDGVESEGILIYNREGAAQRPAVLMVPNWMGMTEDAIAKATRVAGTNKVVFIADVYGKAVRPTNADEARAAATSLRSDRPLLRRRTAGAMETFLALAADHPLDVTRSVAIGFCFGGCAVLELARSGHPVPLVVSFHGNLDTPLPASAESLKSRILVLHGADDPAVPDAMVAAFVEEMRAAQGDWQLYSYGGAVHSFTNPQANTPGRNAYHPQAAARSFAALDLAIAELTELAQE